MIDYLIIILIISLSLLINIRMDPLHLDLPCDNEGCDEQIFVNTPKIKDFKWDFQFEALSPSHSFPERPRTVKHAKSEKISELDSPKSFSIQRPPDSNQQEGI